MAEITVRDVLGDIPAMEYEWDTYETLDPNMIWANYDNESDSFILYTTGKPRGGVHVHLDDGLYVIVDRKTRKVIGFYVEHWESSFVPANAELQRAWAGIKPEPQDAWIMLLRMIALWFLMSLRSNSHNSNGAPHLSPQSA